MESFLIQRTTRQQAMIAGAIALLILLTLAVAAPRAGLQWPAINPFMPMCALTVFTTASIAAFLLGAQFIVTRQPMLGALGGAYAFTALAVALQLLMFPGVFSPTGLFGARPTSAAWMWVFWHGGFPLFVILAVLMRDRLSRDAVADGRVGLWAWLLIGGPVLVGVLLCSFAVLTNLPPPLHAGNGDNPVAVVLWAINAIAVLAVVASGRLRAVLDVWLAVAALACLTDTTLNLLSTDRFTVGWYVARLFSMFAPGVLVCVLVWEVTALYRRLFEAHLSLRQASMRDALTGLYNRTYFNEQIDSQINAAQGNGQPFSLVMVDVDHFKRYNDAFGHLKGDACLAAVAHALAGVVRRPADFIARYGGEEFVVVLPETDANEAQALAERAREAVLRLRIEAAAPSRYVTVSAGCATSAPGNSVLSIDTLVETADAALYRAKAAGRNLVMSAHPLPAALT
ncbi:MULTISPECIES: GGDEF domain-containing protein [Ralstonia]|uniref:diguanylate cyclase n=1 Tax=Ralstonia mojiangensis TaxID=2953895 RepID=A0AAE3LA21_9RALS|nr:sensor domain-containing diguanylate cyclase [Ralstonia mojiangensis]MCO5412337.1 GGDEF domain-containing protein [Ralstonia mojiangensis]MCT7315303.1 GGDEF domain-containing protein [Ralstonia mojiangensis]MCT7325847.1 GGDEF domain-containing protein [Ralstonia mojiangensis]